MPMGSFPEALFMYIFQHNNFGIKQKNLLLHSKVLNKVWKVVNLSISHSGIHADEVIQIHFSLCEKDTI